MRIAFVTNEYVTEPNFDGGLSNYIHRTSLSLLQLGHEVTVFVACDHDEFFVHNEVDVYRVKTANRWLSLFNKLTYDRFARPLRWLGQSLQLCRCLKRINNTKPFDIIQYTSYMATGLFRYKRVSGVVRISSFEPMWRRAYEKPLNLSQRIMEWLELLAIRRADGVFGPSHVIAAVVETEINRSVKIIETPFVPDAVETDPTPYQDLLAGKKYLLFFGSLGLLKGLVTIADTIRPLLEKHPDLWFVFVGKDIGYQRAGMIDYIWEMAGPTRGRVLYLGRMGHDQLYPVLSGALAVVLPSRIDNFPNTCLESFTHKKVVIGTRGASFEQLIEDDVSGFLCEIDDPADLMRAIESVLSLSQSDREAVGEKAFERLDILKPEIAVEKLVEYYKRVKTTKILIL